MGEINYLFIAVLIAMVIGLFKGYRKGFLRLAVYLVGLVFVVMIVTRLSPLLSDYLYNNTDLYASVRGKIITLYEDKTQEALSQNNGSKESMNQSINSMGLPDIISSALVTNNNSDMYKLLAATLFEDYIAGYLARIVIKAGSYVILFIVLGILMLILLCAVSIIEKIPVLKTFNRMLGMLAGLTMSLILVWVFFIGIMMFFANSLGGWLMSQVNSSSLLSFLFNNNILFKLLLKS